MTGTASSAPTMPAMTLPAAIPSTTASGWMDTARPITKGCRERAGEDLGEGAGGRQGTAGQLLLMAAQRADRRVAGLIYLVSAQPQGTVDQPNACAVDTFGDLIDQAW